MDTTVKSVDRAMQILKIVGRYKEGCGVTEISKQIDITKSSVHKILATLTQHQLIEQDDTTGKYRLGFTLLELENSLLESIDLRKIAYPFLRELEKTTNEVIHLVVLDQGEVVYIEKLEGNETLRIPGWQARACTLHRRWQSDTCPSFQRRSRQTVRMSDERKQQLIELMKETGAKISQRMGHQGV